MRKAQKQEVLEMIQTLHQAHDEIKKYIDTKKIQLAQDMLGQCQECAISMGTAIESFEGEGFITVSYIEEYCNVLYQSHETLNTDTSPDSIKIYKNLKKQLLKIENSVKNDIRVRKEVVFFPYKASMWDSLESIYLAAKEDPDCDAYCVPIPYYDRNPDRSLGQMHYEGREYPKNIEVIDWQTYNFEERKPDVIYIHNPYDDWNLVTCVHPRYFSNNLKKYTDKLVYVPYFVLDEIEPDDQARIDTMKHFVWTPGVINADKVIIQSEKMKQIYVNEYLKAAQTNGLQGKHIDRKYLEEKFLGLGSPKFDKVQNTKKEDLEIPEEWLKIIEKPDGSWKKIIFYNTSIAALLENNEKMLEKMKDVFRIFKENKDEVALLWRPHPLIKSTVASMRPQLWVEYEKLVKQYKEEGWGIYDDTSDMDRAVALSDAYYGDPSSVVPVYQQTGKQIIIQKKYLPTQNQNYIAAAEAITYANNKYWYVPYWDNAICCMDSEFSQINILGFVDEKKREGLFSKAVAYKNKIIFIPKLADKIAVYDCEKEAVYQLEFLNKNEFAQESKFLTYIMKDNYLYLIPCNYHSIICIDLENNHIERIKVQTNDIKGTVCAGNAISYHNEIMFPCESEKCLLSYNCENGKVSRIYIGNKNMIYTHLFLVEEKIWLIPFHISDGITVWNMEKNKVEDMILFPKEITQAILKRDIERFPKDIRDSYECGNERYFGKAYQIKNEIYLIANLLGKNVVINTANNKMKCWDITPESKPEILYTYLRSLKIMSLTKNNDELIAISGISGEWFKQQNDGWERENRKVTVYDGTEKKVLIEGRII